MLAGCQTNESESLLKSTGWIGMITSISAFYVAVGQMCEEMLGKEVLPMFYTKEAMLHAGMLYPRLSLTDQRSISVAVPYEGRFEIKKGDTLDALQQPSLVDLNRIQAEHRV